jgi:hypothetical protein
MICNWGSIGYWGSQRGGGSGGVAKDLTPGTVDNGTMGSKVRSLSSNNFGGIGNGQGGSNGQGIAGHTVTQTISNIVSLENMSFRTQVAEATNLVTSSVL